MAHRYPALLADPAPADGRLLLTNARLFDGTGSPLREGCAVLLEEGRIAWVADAGDGAPEGVRVVDLEGRTLIPGLIDVHAHVGHAYRMPSPPHGAEPLLEGTRSHVLGAQLRRVLRMGITTLRDVGSFGNIVLEARQAIRYGAFRGPRLLTCGRIVSATSAGGRFFDGMYRESDGPDEMRRAVREQLRRGADFIKVMTTGARSVEIEDPDPAQMTPREISALVDEAHRMGCRVAAHCEGLAGTELAIEHGVDTIEHGMYLNQRPDLLERLAADGRVLVPTFSCFYGVAGLAEPVEYGGEQEADEVPAPTWSALLVELARHNVEQADLTLKAAHAAGVRLALGYDWGPLPTAALELVRMIRHGLSSREALTAATSGSAYALGLDDLVGTVQPGKLADLAVIDGSPLERPELLLDEASIWLVLQSGTLVAGSALERDPESLGDPALTPVG